MTNAKILDNYYSHPMDLSKMLCNMAKIENETHANEITEVLYHMQTYAQNEYNRDMWRTFYNALVIINQKMQEG